MVYYSIVSSPVGKLLIAGEQSGLKLINFQDGRHPQDPEPDWKNGRRFLGDAIQQIEDYFAGRLTKFSLKLALDGTEFQRCVWRALKSIPYGRTVSYGDIARKIGKTKAPRAVGAANGQNPLSIVVPCHRVIGHSGALVGYGGGLEIKETLLAIERRYSSS